MLVAVVLLLQVQSAQPKPLRPLSRSDSMATARAIQRIRRQETVFFWEWRQAWKNQRDLFGTDPRFWSLHCHYDDVEIGDERNLISTAASRKSMCPIWFQEHGIRGDEALNIDNGIPEKSREKIRKKRDAVLAMLDSAARKDLGNAWILGQRIRLNVDQKEYARAAILAGEQCYSSPALCAMLEGYALAAGGSRRGAEALFEYAAGVMTEEDRCAFLDASFFFEGEDRHSYAARPCAERRELDAKFWWLADPLWARQGNERLAIHVERQTLLLLRSSLTVDEHFDYRAKYGGGAVAQMILRYGWPSVFFYNNTEDDNHAGWLGFRDSTTNASHEYFRPRYHSTPPLGVVEDMATLRGPELGDVAPPWIPRRNAYDEFWWPIEHFSRAGPVISMDAQWAVLRRKRAPAIVVAADPRSTRLPGDFLSTYTTALIAMSGPADSARRSTTPTTIEASGATVATMTIKPGLQVVSAEVLDVDRDSMPATRIRFAVDAPAGLDSLAKDEVGISDVILFASAAGSTSLPRSASDAFERMLPTTDLKDAARVGVFFELYGLAPNEDADVTLSVIPLDQPGLLRRLGARLGAGAANPGSFVVRWEAGKPGTERGVATLDGAVINTRAIVLNLEALKNGRYALDVGVGRAGKPPVVTRREFTLER